MHNLRLGPPIEVGEVEGATHGGPCMDGVYGCHRCWNTANDGKGTLTECESRVCPDKGKELYTRVFTFGYLDGDPTMMAMCTACRTRIQEAEEEELQEELYYSESWR